MQPLVVIGACVGGMEALSSIFAALQADFPAAILVVTHVGACKSLLPELLAPPDLHRLVSITAGLQVIKACGGTVLVQEPEEAPALAGAMPAPPASRDALPAWIAVENRFARGVGNLEQLQKIATPSTFTCPECQGTLWELLDQQSQRFRCHTGHSFTAPILGHLQHEKAEDAIWAAGRGQRVPAKGAPGQGAGRPAQAGTAGLSRSAVNAA